MTGTNLDNYLSFYTKTETELDLALPKQFLYSTDTELGNNLTEITSSL